MNKRTFFKKPHYLILYLLLSSCLANGQQDIFFSEYLEDGRNKCLELFNPTNAAIDLSNYTIEIYINGSLSPVGTPWSFQGRTIGPMSVVVLCQGLSDIPLLSIRDYPFGFGSFNGNDAIVLKNAGRIIDIIGKVGCDPGASWTGGTNRTENVVLVRKACVDKGITNSGGSCSTFTGLASDWIAYAKTNYTHLGNHDFGSIAVEIFGKNALCEENEITLTATAGFRTYSWSNGSNTATTKITTPGTYTVTATTAQNCRATVSKTINGQSPEIFAEIKNVKDVSCLPKLDGGFTIVPSGGDDSGSFTYKWENGESTTPTISGLGAGDYNVTVMDNNGCSVVEEVTIKGITTFSMNVTASGETCKGRGDGSINVSTGENGIQYSLDGNNFQDNGVFNNVLPGTYNVLAIDNSGCGNQERIVIDGGSRFDLRNSLVTQAKCQGEGGGQIFLQPNGGKAPYTVSFDGGPFTNQTIFSDLKGGTFDIVVRDASGCTKPFEQIIEEGSDLLVTDVQTTPATCAGINDGVMNLTTTGGSDRVSINAKNPDGSYAIPQFKREFRELAAGTYRLYAIDNAFRCEIPFDFEITEETPLLTNITQTISCGDSVKGMINILPQTGFAPYNYRLDTGVFRDTNVFIDLDPMTYVVTTMDSLGCIKVDSVNFDTAINFEIDSTQLSHESCANYEDGQITIFANSMNQVQYSLNDIDYVDNAVFSDLASGDYSVYVKSAICSDTAMVTILPATPIVLVDVERQMPLCEGGNDGQLSITVTGGKMPYEYKLDDGFYQENKVFDNLIAGTYSVTVRDSNLCEQIFTDISLVDGIKLEVDCTVAKHVSTKDGSDGLVNVTISGGTPPYNVQLVDAGFNNVITLSGLVTFNTLPVGDYIVEVTDRNGCATTCSFTIEQPQCNFSIDKTQLNATCFEALDGRISLILPTANAPFNIDWSSDEYDGRQQLTGLRAGVYSVTVTDQADCIDSLMITITEPPPLVIEIIADNLTICEKDSAQLRVTDTYAQYNWSNTSTSATTKVYEEGRYHVTVRNGAGCVATDDIVINVIPQDTMMDTRFTCDESSIGTFAVEERGTDGCMDIVLRTFELARRDTTFLTTTTCNPIEEGVVQSIYSNAVGCDSLVITTTNLLRSDTIYQTEIGCNSDELGIRREVLSNSVGCDSTLIIETILNTVLPQSAQSVFTCHISEVGIDTMMLKTLTGCDSLVITMTNLLRSDTTYQTDVSCNVNDLGVREVVLSNAVGCDSMLVIATTLDESLEQSALTVFTCNLNEVGIDTAFLKTFAGCDSLVITQTISNVSELTNLTTSTCNPADVGIDTLLLTNQFLCDSLLISNTTLAPSDFIQLTEQSCNPSDTGVVLQNLFNQFGCDSIVEISTILRPINECELVFSLIADTICWDATHGTVQITITTGIPPFEYAILNDFWRDTVQCGLILTTDEATILTNIPVGRYSIVLINDRRVSNEKRIAVTQADEMIIDGLLSDYAGFSVSCEGQTDGSIDLDITNGKAPYTYLWGDGEEVGNLQNLAARNYQVTITDANGCQQRTDFDLFSAPEMSLDFQSFSPKCFEDIEGSVTIYDLPNANGAVEYSLDGMLFQPIDALPFTIENLPPNDYQLFVQDENDCQASAFFSVPISNENQLSLGVTKSLILGDSLILTPEADFEIDRYEWTATVPLMCENCSVLKTIPTGNGIYTLTAYDANGCQSTASVTVNLRKESQVYLPNVFSPNGDGENDLYQVLTGNIVKTIKHMRIFDYEGRLMYQVTNRPPNDASVGWDGMFNGQKMLPGVFVVFVEVELLDGDTERYQQTMTLVK